MARPVFAHAADGQSQIRIMGFEEGYQISVRNASGEDAKITVSRNVTADLYRALLRDLIRSERA